MSNSDLDNFYYIIIQSNSMLHLKDFQSLPQEIQNTLLQFSKVYFLEMI